jgi:tRNA pseudouridine65 synthase
MAECGCILHNSNSPPLMDVLFRDAALLAVNKPSGLITHRGWANDADNALRRARALAQQYVYPVHRLDRGTSGVLLFALSKDVAGLLGEQLQAGGFQKHYLALVRGITADRVEVDHCLASNPGEERKPAQTSVLRLGTFERYSLVEARPHTGRAHQVRRHLKHLSHPVLGDTRFGNGEHNRACRTRFALHRLALHAAKLSFAHPLSGERIVVRATLPADLVEPLGAMALDQLAQDMIASE